MSAQEFIVRKLPDESDEPLGDDVVDDAVNIEASLLPHSQRLLRQFPVEGLEEPYLRHLEQRIQRNPRDLLSHVRRLVMRHADNDTGGTYAALLDLFLVLGSHGRTLRTRLLSLAEQDLTPEQSRFFHAHMDEGLVATDVTAAVPGSCLSSSIAGTVNIVNRLGGDRDQGDELVALARESLANGHDKTALELLEGALAADPGCEEVCLELLSLYERRNLRADFMRTYTATMGRQLALPDLWRKMAEHFETDEAAGVTEHG